MGKNKIREKLQNKVVSDILVYNKVLLTWATGVGKSLAALKAVEAILSINPNAIGYLICKENSHLDNWNIEMKTHKKEVLLHNMSSFLYASLHKWKDTKPDFIILDECHAITPKRLELLKKMVGVNTYIIALSATVEEDKRILLEELGKFKRYNISISKAIELTILPHPKIFVHYFNLDDKIRDNLIEYKTGIVSRRIKKQCFFSDMKIYIEKFPHLELTVKCTEKEYYLYISDEIMKLRNAYFGMSLKGKGAEFLKNKWLQLASQRKRYIADLKTKYAKELIKSSFSGYRYICFTHSKAQAEYISPNNYVHSDLSKDEVILRKNNFNNGTIDNIVVVNMFKEAINLKNIHKGLIVQLDNVKLSFIQQLGRVFRSDFPEIHVIVLRNTQDEKYLKKVLEGFDKKYIININN